MRKALLFLLLAVAVLAMAAALNGFELNRLLNPGLYARFGNFGGLGRPMPAAEPFHPNALRYGIRWFPTYVSFGPDDDTLLVSLCHVDGPGYCRIGRYSLAKDHWDIYAFEERESYSNPLLSPDGQWLYFTATPLCADLRNFCDRPKLYRMRPNGTGRELFADVSARAPSFSLDGKRLIYWGRMGPNAIANTEVHYLDLESRREVRLTENIPHPSGPVFFTADGKHFLFQGGLDYWRGHTSCTVDPKEVPADPKTGRKDFGPLFGDKNETGIYLAAVDDAPIGKDNCRKLTPIWGADSGHTGGPPCAMDGQGRLLYAANLGEKKRQGDPVALALRPAAVNYQPQGSMTIEKTNNKYPFSKLTQEQLQRGDGAVMSIMRSMDSDTYRSGKGMAVFLRGVRPQEYDTAAFDLGGCSDGMSLSHDGQQLGLVWGMLPNNSNAIGVIHQGQPLKEARLILNWPKLDLIPTLPANR